MLQRTFSVLHVHVYGWVSICVEISVFEFVNRKYTIGGIVRTAKGLQHTAPNRHMHNACKSCVTF